MHQMYVADPLVCRKSARLDRCQFIVTHMNELAVCYVYHLVASMKLLLFYVCQYESF